MKPKPACAAIAAVAMLAACGAQGSDAVAEEPTSAPPSSTSEVKPPADPAPSTTEATSSTTAPDAAEPAGLDCAAAPSDASPDLPNGREITNEVDADLDGDGEDDRLSTFSVTLGEGEVMWMLHVVTADGYAAEVELSEADSIANVRPLGTVAIGDGHRAALVVEGVGASAELVSLWGLHHYDDDPCSLGRLTVGDDTAPLLYPVGGTAGSAEGLICTEVDGTPALAATTVTQVGDDENDWTSQQLTWSGAGAMNLAGTEEGSIATAEVADYTGIDCPGIDMG